MKIQKFDGSTTLRIPLVRGENSKGEIFVMSVLTDGTGVVMEFQNDEAYLLSTQELVREILSQRINDGTI